ncbi:hypothetical protein EXIGLDRAFT_733923 [Exidia glandulosa HHB12029]|uniref:Succinate dehydrogenase assembly factor 4, mitochondrial n=1 Tax=Exidia glandulosa HHB12029 TaxID=1314781 RepID=A0A166AXS5_EXIGL|nr:hypothetical protein EXIGLDRAFT_733923 [Exidia glandulosa HHB12029]
MLRRCISTIPSRRLLHTTSTRLGPLDKPRPGPPPLPPAEQREFEALIKAAESAPNLVHPDARAPKRVEFEGDVNPKTGEQGGPKTEPTTHGDWSFGGRATDF